MFSNVSRSIRGRKSRCASDPAPALQYLQYLTPSPNVSRIVAGLRISHRMPSRRLVLPSEQPMQQWSPVFVNSAPQRSLCTVGELSRGTVGETWGAWGCRTSYPRFWEVGSPGHQATEPWIDRRTRYWLESASNKIIMAGWGQ